MSGVGGTGRSRRSALRLLCVSSGSVCAGAALAACTPANLGDPAGPLVQLPSLEQDRMLLLAVADFPQLLGEWGGLVGRVPGVAEPVAITRDARSNFVAMVGMCTHMACVLRFNALNATLDCPCHGSSFELDGTVLNGPAVTSLRVLPTTFDGARLTITMK